MAPIVLPLAQQQQQRESQSNGLLKPLKLSRPIPLKTETVSQLPVTIPIDSFLQSNQDSFSAQNQIKPLSYNLKKNKLLKLNQPISKKQQRFIQNQNSDNIQSLKSKSFEDIKSPNSLYLFEPASPLDTYKTKLSK